MKETQGHDHSAAPVPAQDRRDRILDAVTGPVAGPTLATVRRQATARLGAAGIDSAALDARILVGHALGLDRHQLLTRSHCPVPAPDLARLEALLARRLAREPVSRILGWREFWSLPFVLAPDTLDPRPDSETLVTAALEVATPGPGEILDLGTGSGCLLLALLRERTEASGLGLDASQGAVDVACANAARLGLAARARFQRADWTESLVGRLSPRRFPLIVANPPYIPDADIPGLEPEVSRFEPRLALAGGPDGLDAYRQLAPQLPELLTPGGWAVFEVGCGQTARVAALFEAAGLDVPGSRADLAGIERCVLARTRR